MRPYFSTGVITYDRAQNKSPSGLTVESLTGPKRFFHQVCGHLTHNISDRDTVVATVAPGYTVLQVRTLSLILLQY